MNAAPLVVLTAVLAQSLLAGIGALAVRGYGLTVLTHPWNPYFPVLLWLVALVATWSVLAGDHWFLACDPSNIEAGVRLRLNKALVGGGSTGEGAPRTENARTMSIASAGTNATL